MLTPLSMGPCDDSQGEPQVSQDALARQKYVNRLGPPKVSGTADVLP